MLHVPKQPNLERENYVWGYVTGITYITCITYITGITGFTVERVTFFRAVTK